MIIVINPMLSNQQLNSDSNYVYLRELLTEILMIMPDWIFFMIWPTGTGWKYYSDGFFEKHPQIIRIPKKWQEGKYRAGCDYDTEFWFEFLNRTPCNLIWNNTVEQTPLFWNVNPQKSPSFITPVVTFHHFPAHKTLPGLSNQYRGVQGLQAMGTVLSDFNIFNSNHCQWMMNDICKDFFSLQILDEIKQKSKLIYMGPINAEFPRTENYDSPVFFYNHRIAGYKNWEETFTMFDKLYEEEKNFKVIVTTVDTQSVTRVARRPYVEAVNCFKREQYLEQIQRANINVSNSQHETFCISMVESMAAGHACIAPNRITFPELFDNGKAGLLFQTEDQQYALMKKLINDKVFRKEWGEKASIRAREFFSTKRYAEETIALFKKVYDENAVMPNSEKKQELENAIRTLPASMEFMPAYRKVQGKLGWMNQAFPILYFVVACQKYGVKFSVSNQKVYVKNDKN